MMKDWSEKVINPKFRIKIFFDTNILCYLIDNTYPNLTASIEFLKSLEFVDFISSNYVIFEFVGVRKKEHYLQKVLEYNTSTDSKGRVNLSSLLKYQGRFESEVKFDEVQAEIETKVQDELNIILNTFTIDYEKNILHEGLLTPTIKITLNSKISKEDALVLTSSILPTLNTINENIVMFSNDSDFITLIEANNIDTIFSNLSIEKPSIINLKKMKLLSGTEWNLTDKTLFSDLEMIFKTKVIELLKKNKSVIYLGKTINCGHGNNFNNVICFELEPNILLNQGSYLTIIDSNLEFIYNISIPVTDFWENTSIETYPVSYQIPTNISFKLTYLPANFQEISQSGNLIFITPE